jgi:hypothetical protein
MEGSIPERVYSLFPLPAPGLWVFPSMRKVCVALVLAGCLCAPALAANPAQEFAERHLSAPEMKVMWLTPALKQRAEAILGHAYAGLRVRYWQQGARTVWVLDEIGKEQPITAGIVVESGRIADMQVLTYRESRGGEVRQAFFLRQFKDATLTAPKDALSRRVDGITGATLSVWAMQRMARLALLFDSQRVQ